MRSKKSICVPGDGRSFPAASRQGVFFQMAYSGMGKGKVVENGHAGTEHTRCMFRTQRAETEMEDQTEMEEGNGSPRFWKSFCEETTNPSR